VSEWVRRLGVANEHLTTDAGELYLAFAGLFAWAAWRPARELVVPLCVAWAAAQAVHLGYHLTRLDGFPVADAVGQSLSLALLAALPLALLRLTAR
jgi:hypothetical protein